MSNTLDEEEISFTVIAYEQAKKLHPKSNTKTTRLVTAAEIVTIKFGKKVGYKAIENRLVKFGFTDW
jgi:cytochrome c-type biogenesis protein CcmH/NrfG